MWSWLATVALAAIPDRLVSTELGVSSVTGSVDGLAASADGVIIAGVAGNQAVILETEGWSAFSWSTCSVASVAPGPKQSDGWRTYVGCTDGTVRAILWDGEDFSVDTDWNETVEASATVEALWAYNNVLYALTSDSDLQLHRVSIDTQQVDGTTGFPSQAPTTGFKDAALTSTGVLVVQHAAKQASYWTSIAGSTPAPDTYAFPNRGIDDLTVGSDGVWALERGSESAWIGQWQNGSPFTARLTGVSDARAILRSPTSSESWLGVFGGSGQATSTIYTVGTDISEYFTFDLTDTAVDAVADPNGDYAYVGTTDGDIRVITANPWVTVSLSASEALAGDVVTVTFTVDEDAEASVDWTLMLGGDRDGGGEELDRGTAVAGQPVTLDVTVDSSWTEGTNWIYVLADEGAESGHGRVGLLVDNPPEAPVLASTALGVGNEALNLTIPAPSDADIASYEVYVMTTPFDGSAFSQGGPVFDGSDSIVNPITVTANGTSSTTVKLSPLTNGTTYYVAVRAIDDGGAESALSNTISASPVPTSSAADAAGETGGCEKEFTCATGVGRSAGFLALLPLAWATLRRRRTAPVAGAVLLAAAAPGAARAEENTGVFGPDTTPAWANFEARYGMVTLSDPNLTDAFGANDNNMLRIELGAQVYRYLEFDIGVGFLQEIDFKRTATGAKSDERQMITWVPLSASATARAHFFDEQPLVPYAKIGLDLVPWDIQTDNTTGGKDKLHGTKWGWHWGVGGNLLLDWIAPKRASQLEATTGINDTYFTVDYRVQRVGAGAQGFDFSASEVTFGLKVDY